MVMKHRARSWAELPPPVGTRLLIVSRGLERGYLRARSFEETGYRVSTCGEPAEVSKVAEQFAPDGIVVDLGRDDGRGAQFVRLARECTLGPLVVVATGGSLAEMKACFEAGADEVVAPRTPTPELDLRLRALLRMLARRAEEETKDERTVLRIGEIEIDASGQVVRKRGKVVALSPTEFRLLVTLAENAGRVVPSKALIARVWGDQYASETHYLRLYVRYLRQKLEDDPSQPAYIVNRWGAGYTLEEPARAA
jgi:two-component system, OmpR family, KDP operon response regulator KdpE